MPVVKFILFRIKFITKRPNKKLLVRKYIKFKNTIFFVTIILEILILIME